ncbi:hypothetical protein PAHAL_9G097800 [Panicum hallii]|uniref:Uncharacterized protein n=1 Tax=Panicum hallii TaxID=206008 RepID=A0A2T8I0S7_9POAL|nr:hypothetical protein PAHAL_9G097800 [Panicum hallii]
MRWAESRRAVGSCGYASRWREPRRGGVSGGTEGGAPRTRGRASGSTEGGASRMRGKSGVAEGAAVRRAASRGGVVGEGSGLPLRPRHSSEGGVGAGVGSWGRGQGCGGGGVARGWGWAWASALGGGRETRAGETGGGRARRRARRRPRSRVARAGGERREGVGEGLSKPNDGTRDPAERTSDQRVCHCRAARRTIVRPKIAAGVTNDPGGDGRPR